MGPTAREPERRELAVVPHRPGPVIRLDDPSGAREPDELDELIDDLLPDADERAGWLDAALLVLGAGLLAWAAVGDPPAFVMAIAVVALALGCILPLRAAWRGVRRRRERSTLAKGLPLDVSVPVVRRLVDAYEAVRGFATDPAVGAAALSAAHGALMEVATLLDGRAPVSAAELEYVDPRATAVEALGAALQEAAASPGPATRPRIVAREELDRIAGFSSVSRLDELTDEVRARHGDQF